MRVRRAPPGREVVLAVAERWHGAPGWYGGRTLDAEAYSWQWSDKINRLAESPARVAWVKRETPSTAGAGAGAGAGKSRSPSPSRASARRARPPREASPEPAFGGHAGPSPYLPQSQRGKTGNNKGPPKRPRTPGQGPAAYKDAFSGLSHADADADYGPFDPARYQHRKRPASAPVGSGPQAAAAAAAAAEVVAGALGAAGFATP